MEEQPYELEDEQQQAVAAAAAAAASHHHHHHHHTSYSLYEPHYQQMHPLLYFEEPTHLQHNPQQQQQHHHQQLLHNHQQHAVPSDMENFGFSFSDADIIYPGSGNAGPASAGGNSQSNSIRLKLEEALGAAINSEVTISNQMSDGLRATMKVETTTPPLITTKSTTGTSATSTGDAPKAGNGGLSGPTNRELHNEIERRRRLRIKQCCDILRNLVPGLNDKTDKATVLEFTVRFVRHLLECPGYNCNCEF